jgi:hypothetical protein
MGLVEVVSIQEAQSLLAALKSLKVPLKIALTPLAIWVGVQRF